MLLKVAHQVNPSVIIIGFFVFNFFFFYLDEVFVLLLIFCRPLAPPPLFNLRMQHFLHCMPDSTKPFLPLMMPLVFGLHVCERAHTASVMFLVAACSDAKTTDAVCLKWSQAGLDEFSSECIADSWPSRSSRELKLMTSTLSPRRMSLWWRSEMGEGLRPLSPVGW